VAAGSTFGGHDFSNSTFDLPEENAMRHIAAFIFVTAMTTCAFAQTSVALSEPKLSPAERSMAQATKLMEKNPKDFEAYNALALALSRRARETSDVKFYAMAEEALQKSFAISPNNFDGARIHVWLLLGKHEFAAALEEAKPLNKKIPDDIMLYGFLTDANVELGNYADAEKAAQWMLDLRPGNLPGMTRAAYLRELFGDIDGSLELMRMAYESTPPTEAEDGAWILSQMGHLQLMAGKPEEAEKLLSQALTQFPGYHYALANLAKVRILQKRYEDAVTLLRQRYDAAQHAENLYDLAEALELAGHTEEAAKDFAEFEKKSLAESVKGDNSNRELIFYYADHAHQPIQALKIAELERSRRHDVSTLDAYAWALHVNGRDAEAKQSIEAALAVGIQDARFFHHAGVIALGAGDKKAAAEYLQKAASLKSPVSEQARIALANLAAASASLTVR
jgi:tetratricopeptide (TPR) repeat protein